MKVYLIKAGAKNDYTEYKKNTGGPPQNIFSTAAATPKGVEIEMTDETHGMKVNFKSDALIVAIFMSTPDAVRAYEIAEKFRTKGTTVILGGLHTYFMQEEAAEHADALLLGEPEEIWEQLINDYKTNSLQKIYKRKTPFDLANLNPYPLDIIDPSNYDYTWSVVVSRGCQYQCDFCLVHKFFDSYNLRPIESIVAEIRSLKDYGIEWCELHSDNLTANREYILKLFKALEPLGMNFYGETTILIARDEEILEAANKAGVKVLLLGIETISKEALKDQKKSFVKPEKIKEYVDIIRKHGISVSSDFLFGFDAHDNNIFEETVDFIKGVNFDEVYPHLVIPFPGSDTFKKLDSEDRLLTKDWSQYDGTHSVFKPAKMTTTELENGTYWVFTKVGKTKW